MSRGSLVVGIEALPAHVSSRIDRSGECWIWLGSVNPIGHGQVTVDRRKWLAHRFIYTVLVGPVEPRLVLHHVCETKLCVNPSHLEELTRSQHLARSPQVRVAQRITLLARTHCVHGHEYTPENTTITSRDGARRCRTCSRLVSRRLRGVS